MKVLSLQGSLEQFFRRLTNASVRLLMLDYDGVLSPLQVDRQQAHPWPGITDRLEKLTREASCQVTIISGRMADEVAELLDCDPLPEIWGNHGWERRSSQGDLLQSPLPERLQDALSRACQLAQAAWDRDVLEVKHAGLVLHHRGGDEAFVKKMDGWVAQHWQTFGETADLRLHAMDGGYELRAEAHHKGKAVETLLQEGGADCWGAYLGDDVTDEDAFAALKGKGLSVLVRPELRATQAELWLQPPQEVWGFLDQWEAACRKSS